MVLALAGWFPPGAAGRVVYRRGRLVGLHNDVLWWQDEWEAPSRAPSARDLS